MTDIDTEKWDNAKLFASTTELLNEETITFSGTIPQWLKGTLYRNGPGANEINNDPSTSVKHAFDGLAFIQKYAIEGSSQTVRFRGSFVKSRTYKEAIKHGHLVTRQFGTDPCKSIFGRFQLLFRGNDARKLTDDTSVNIQKVNDELVAFTETIIGNIIDSDTLETVGPLTTLPYTTPVESETMTATTAHVMYDEKRKMTVAYASRITMRNNWLDVIFISDKNTNETELTEAELDDKIISIDDRFLVFTTGMSERAKQFNRRIRSNATSYRFPFEKVSYMHSAVLTENFLVLSEIPFHFSSFSALRTLLGGSAFTNMFTWNGAKMPTIFRIISLDTGKQIAQIYGPAFFDFHHVNAYELNNESEQKIVIDICAYDDHRIIDELYLKNLRNNDSPSGGGFLRQFHLDLKTNTCTEPYAGAREGQGMHPISYANSLVPVQFELPRLNPNYIGKAYRFCYAVRSPPDHFLDALIKIDVEKKEQNAIWYEPCTSPSEPIFVPKPHAVNQHVNEDDGVVLSVVFDQKMNRSFLLVLDGNTFKELGRAYLPMHIPLSFHGNFY